MVRTPTEQMSRDDLCQEVDQLRAEVDRLKERKVANAPASFRERLHAARPDLQVFRGRPRWQKAAIRAVWRLQTIFGFEGWVPGRERKAAEASEGEVICTSVTNRPIAYVRRYGDRVELTLFAERRDGFLDYVAANGGEVVHQLVRSFERQDDVRGMTEGDHENG